jgi:inosine/xanthosine triphosphatase
MKTLVVASKNPVKIAAVKNGFEKMFPAETFSLTGVSVSSGIGDQPVSDAQTQEGAWNRAHRAADSIPDADFWVGIEGGVEDKAGEMESFAWIVVRSRDGKTGRGRSSAFFLPHRVAELVRGGMELGAADDVVFARTNSKQENGAVGLLTHDVIDRTHYYTDAVVLALIPFVNKELY